MAKSPYVHDRLDDDDDAFGPDGCLRDGKSTRVSVMMRDAAMTPLQRAIAEDTARRPSGVVFGDGSDLARHRPGPRRCADAAARDAVEQARAEWIAEMCDAWRKPIADVSGEARGQRPGDQCTINGAPGHLNHRLECIPDKRQDAVPSMSVDAAQALRDAAYEESVRREENEWRGPAR
jgi:hypothetical protein